MSKYELPSFLAEVVPTDRYKTWLHRKASAHVRRDRKRGQPSAKIQQYKEAIHEAVNISNGLDPYTGEHLDWSLIQKWNNNESQRGGAAYKTRFALLPSVDHVQGAGEDARFKICAWRTNDAKSDLSYADFLDLCEKVVRFAKRS